MYSLDSIRTDYYTFNFTNLSWDILVYKLTFIIIIYVIIVAHLGRKKVL